MHRAARTAPRTAPPASSHHLQKPTSLPLTVRANGQSNDAIGMTFLVVDEAIWTLLLDTHCKPFAALVAASVLTDPISSRQPLIRRARNPSRLFECRTSHNSNSHN